MLYHDFESSRHEKLYLHTPRLLEYLFKLVFKALLWNKRLVNSKIKNMKTIKNTCWPHVLNHSAKTISDAQNWLLNLFQEMCCSCFHIFILFINFIRFICVCMLWAFQHVRACISRRVWAFQPNGDFVLPLCCGHFSITVFAGALRCGPFSLHVLTCSLCCGPGSLIVL